MTTRTYGGGEIVVGKIGMGPSHVVGIKRIVRMQGPPVAFSFGMLSLARHHVKTGLIPSCLRGIAAPSRCRVLRVGHVSKFMSHTHNLNHPAGGSHHRLRRFASLKVVGSKFSFRFSFRRPRSRRWAHFFATETMAPFRVFTY